MANSFSDKVVIVTGSSSGIGRATAQLFAESGARVVLHGQSAQRLKEAEMEIRAAGATDASLLVVRGCLTDEHTPRRLIQETVAKFGRLDVLVNNAGSARKDGCDDVFSLELFDYIIHLNLRCVIELSHLAIPHLAKTKGCIVNVGSITGLNTGPELPYYSTVKAALHQYTRVSAILCAPKGVRVNCVVPGLTKTNILQAYGINQEDSDRIFAARRCGLFAGAAESREIATVIRFLADDMSAAKVTGVLLPVDGGETTNAIAPLLGDQRDVAAPAVMSASTNKL